jgi:hypothetical protein
MSTFFERFRTIAESDRMNSIRYVKLIETHSDITYYEDLHDASVYLDERASAACAHRYMEQLSLFVLLRDDPENCVS